MNIAEYTLRVQELTIAAFHTLLFLIVALAIPVVGILAFKDFRAENLKKGKP